MSRRAGWPPQGRQGTRDQNERATDLGLEVVRSAAANSRADAVLPVKASAVTIRLTIVAAAPRRLQGTGDRRRRRYARNVRGP